MNIFSISPININVWSEQPLVLLLENECSNRNLQMIFLLFFAALHLLSSPHYQRNKCPFIRFLFRSLDPSHLQTMFDRRNQNVTFQNQSRSLGLINISIHYFNSTRCCF